MKRIKALVLDLDGTLVNSLPDLSFAMNRTLEYLGRSSLPEDTYRFMVGRGIRQLLTNVTAEAPLDPQSFEGALVHFLDYYSRHSTDFSRPYDGMPEALEALQGQLQLAVLSNKDHDLTVQVVTQLFPGISFSVIRGAQTGVPHKPDPEGLRLTLQTLGAEASQTLYLGDTDVDMQTAVRGHCIPCGALWGFRTRQELVDHGAQFCFESPKDFLEWVQDQLSKP